MEIPLLLVVASLIGTGLNVVRGWSASKDNISAKKIAGGVITSIIATLATISVFDAANIGGPIQTILLGLLVGFGSDFAISKLKK